MKNTYTKKINVLLIFCLLLITGLNAQIIYTDIPDTTIIRTSAQPGTTIFIINLNGDTANDYNINVQSQIINAAGCPVISPAYQTNLNAWIGTMPLYSNYIGDSAGYVASVQTDSVIGPSAFTWSSIAQNYFYNKSYAFPGCIWDSTFNGYWQGDTNFIAVKMRVGTQIHFGWIRALVQTGLDTSNNSFIAVTIFDYAYNTIADSVILAGQTNSVGINESPFADESRVSVFVNPVNNSLTIQNKSSLPVILSVYNSLGELIMSKSSEGEWTHMDISDLSNDIYIYYLASDRRFIKSGKFIKM